MDKDYTLEFLSVFLIAVAVLIWASANVPFAPSDLLP